MFFYQGRGERFDPQTDWHSLSANFPLVYLSDFTGTEPQIQSTAGYLNIPTWALPCHGKQLHVISAFSTTAKVAKKTSML